MARRPTGIGGPTLLALEREGSKRQGGCHQGIDIPHGEIEFADPELPDLTRLLIFGRGVKRSRADPAPRFRPVIGSTLPQTSSVLRKGLGHHQHVCSRGELTR